MFLYWEGAGEAEKGNGAGGHANLHRAAQDEDTPHCKPSWLNMKGTKNGKIFPKE